MAYDNNMTGAMFKNDKGDNPKRPDMRGSIEIDGVKYWLSGWSRVADKGKYAGQKYLSIKAQLDDTAAQPAKPSTQSANPAAALGLDDGESIPF